MKLITIGDHIRNKRIELGLYQKDVAQIIGVDTCSIYNWEKNRSQPKLYLLPKVIEFLGYIPFELKAITHGERILLYRDIRGLSQKKLAKEICVDPATLTRWEKNHGNPFIKFQKDIESFLLCHLTTNSPI